MATATGKRKYESGTQRYTKLSPLAPHEKLDYRRRAVTNAIDQLRHALANDPGSLRTYAYAVCSRYAEYDSALTLESQRHQSPR